MRRADRPLDRTLIPDEELHRWADFFVGAGLYPLLRFSEFIREPEAIVAALCDVDAPLPQTLPWLRQRIEQYALTRSTVRRFAQRARRVAGAQ